MSCQVQSNQGSSTTKASTKPGKLSDVEIFSGFKPAIEACYLDWEDYQIPGVTYGHNSKYLCPFTVFKQPAETDSAAGRAGTSQVNSSQAVLRCEYPGVTGHRPRSGQHQEETARNSLSSEEIPSDEGLEAEEAPSQSEGETGNIGNQCAANPSGTQANTEETSPERELESDWSNGAPPVAPPPADPQDYRVYFYDPKVPLASLGTDSSKEEVDIFKNLRKPADAWEILFMRAEGIHAHGYQSHAAEMAVRLAGDMLKNPPDLITDAPPIAMKGKKRRVCAASHQVWRSLPPPPPPLSPGWRNSNCFLLRSLTLPVSLSPTAPSSALSSARRPTTRTISIWPSR